MSIDFLHDVFRSRSDADALVWQERQVSYGWLDETVVRQRHWLGHEGVPRGAVVSLEADFSPQSVALLLSLIEHGCVTVPITAAQGTRSDQLCKLAQVEVRVRIDDEDRIRLDTERAGADHPLLLRLKEADRPGLVLFSSGSTGTIKAAVHDFVPLLEKFRARRNAWRTVALLHFDHIGGLNTLFYTLANGGALVTVADRSPEVVCRQIERFRAQLLPASPTFLNIMLLSDAHRRYDLSSLEMITYGTEVMPETTLQRLRKSLPTVRLLQTYGLSEVGILHSRSRSSGSLWVKVGGEGFETRVVEGMLEIKARSAMLGYLNAPSPFTEDGWLRTDDAVEVDGEYIRILGRGSDVINVGGEKVYPAEVESVLQRMSGVDNVTVWGESNAITGQIIRADVRLATSESIHEFRKRMVRFCRDALPIFKIPQKVVLVTETPTTGRLKKQRRS